MTPGSPSQKRSKLDLTPDSSSNTNPAVIRLQRSAFLSSLSRSVSPPGRANSHSGPSHEVTLNSSIGSQSVKTEPQAISSDDNVETVALEGTGEVPSESSKPTLKTEANVIPSPFQFTSIRDLPPKDNADTIGVRDILGEVMIKEAWIFNFLFNVDWIMQQFDSDTRDLVSVTLIHGSWKREDANRIYIEEACSRYHNVQAVAAWLDDPFGTHHTKMIILFRHDDLAQVIIHTANMIPKDWTNMTNAAWRSPLLPRLANSHPADNAPALSASRQSIGSGKRFKHDLLQYLKAYGKKKTGALVEKLSKYSFDMVRGALIGSIPSKTRMHDPELSSSKLWGWLGLRDALREIYEEQGRPQNHLATSNPNSRKRAHSSSSASIDPPCPFKTTPRKDLGASTPHIISQISSIATLPQYWLNHFFSTLSTPSPPRSATHSIIFPTAESIRNSLDGYASGTSIHTKIQSSAQRAQVDRLRPHLCDWSTAEDHNESSSGKISGRTKAGRALAAPHIKTYIRFSSKPTVENLMPDIEWALLTSANLSVQAWGSVPAALTDEGAGSLSKSRSKKQDEDKEPEVKISSYELGVLVWAGLYLDDETRANVGPPKIARMVPVFGKDMADLPALSCTETQNYGGLESAAETVIGVRMPYNLPPVPYGKDDMPWCTAVTYSQPDRWGRSWGLDGV